MKILSLNIRGIGKGENKKELIHKHKIDICFIQKKNMESSKVSICKSFGVLQISNGRARAWIQIGRHVKNLE